MRHPISGEIKELEEKEFLELFDESVRHLIKNMARSKTGIEAVVCMENLQIRFERNW